MGRRAVVALMAVVALVQRAGVRGRWALTLAWTALAASLMLSPSGDGTAVTFISKLFGGTSTSDAVGHFLINGVLALLWCWTLSLYASPAHITRLVLIGGCVWGVVGELAQYLAPQRGVALLDVGANLLGVVIGVLLYGWFRVERTSGEAS